MLFVSKDDLESSIIKGVRCIDAEGNESLENVIFEDQLKNMHYTDLPKVGVWIEFEAFDTTFDEVRKRCKCSQCGGLVYLNKKNAAKLYTYCYNCGSKNA